MSQPVIAGSEQFEVVKQDFEERERRREWNRGPLQDLFPRIPQAALERVLDICIVKNFTYNLSQPKVWNARRFSSIVVAHVRHTYSDYDKLWHAEGVERFEARKRTGPQVLKLLKQWSPWSSSNEVLERCFQATLLRPEERDPEWDPMDLDEDETEALPSQFYYEPEPMDLS
ncbi:hypothetical protein K431DRAFT_221515 [Polychaeton citri CBS 116435]|uniref:DUF2293 domain-containing protein n=1 Tax=Polychaeton citri CBS 116435 TaxID=1314669 RepID=A0A9P4QAJ9_9PEZI|nr:hypothetical protein K431DRAFT_221515 [Polychaeton citri CBS 116435]